MNASYPLTTRRLDDVIACTGGAEIRIDAFLGQVMHLAGLTQQAGLDGVVCSSQEASMLKESFGESFLLVTPGIRPRQAASGDQKRIMTPVEALRAGSDYLVIGRPITQSSSPLEALETISEDIKDV